MSALLTSRDRWRLRSIVLLPVIAILAVAVWHSLRAQRHAAAERHYQAGLDAMRTGDETTAVREMLAASRRAPERAEFHFQLSDALQQLHQPQQAAEHRERALRLGPPQESGYIRLVEAYWTLGRFADAERVLRRDVFPRWPDSAEGAYYQGLVRFYGSKGDTAVREAAASFERCLRLKPDHPNARYQYAVCLAALGQLREAERAFKEVLASTPAHTAALYGLAGVLNRQQERVEAREVLAKFRRIDTMQRRVTYLTAQLAIRKDLPEALLELGELYLQLDRPDKAAELLIQYSRQKPEDTRALRKLASACRRMQLTADALQIEKRVAALEAGRGRQP